MHLEWLPCGLAVPTDEASIRGITASSGTEVMRRDDGDLLALFTTKWVLRMPQEASRS